MLAEPALQNIFLQGLNPQQLEAALIQEGPALCSAIPGSGKSTCMTRRLGDMLVNRGVDPTETLTLTFTKKAAAEMQSKLRHNIQNHYAYEEYDRPFDQLGGDQQYGITTVVHQEYLKGLTCGTFHSVCSRLLRKNISRYEEEGRTWNAGFSFLEPRVLMAKVKEIAYKEMNVDSEKFQPGSIISGISKFKMNCLIPEDVMARNRVEDVYLEVYTRLRKFQAEENLIDFDDMIMMTARILNMNPEIRNRYHNTFKHISVDEFQDTDQAQYNIVKALACNGLTGNQFTDWTGRSLFVVGDVDQCIYSWRNSDISLMLNFDDEFKNNSDKHDVKLLKIEHNYRSTSTITGAANVLIKNNQVRIDKNIVPTRDKGSLIQVIQKKDNVEEARFIATEIKKIMDKNPQYSYKDFAVLVRQNAFTLQIEKALTTFAIPYLIGGGRKFNERREVKIVLSYLQLLANPHDNSALNYIINVPKRGIGTTTLNRVYEACRDTEQSAYELLTTADDLKELVGRSHKALGEFIAFFKEMQEEATDLDVYDTTKLVIDKTNLYSYLASDADSSENADERQQNVDALLTVANEFILREPNGSLQEFIDQMVLDGIETSEKENADAVRVMTVHASKGLEFGVVFVAGMESAGFPCKMDYMSPDTLEESRRLFYVAITRAKDLLYLTWAKTRWVRKTVVDGRGRRESYEEMEVRQPSPFLKEIPAEFLSTMPVAA
jgi:DNA helicase II / ATP-dependent DNA helicase PcrA